MGFFLLNLKYQLRDYGSESEARDAGEECRDISERSNVCVDFEPVGMRLILNFQG